MNEKEKALLDQYNMKKILENSSERLPKGRREKRERMLKELMEGREKMIGDVYGSVEKVPSNSSPSNMEESQERVSKVERDERDKEMIQYQLKSASSQADNMRKAIIQEYLNKFQAEMGESPITSEELEENFRKVNK